MLPEIIPLAVLAGIYPAFRLLVFVLALIAHVRYKVPLEDLRRLIAACFPPIRLGKRGDLG